MSYTKIKANFKVKRKMKIGELAERTGMAASAIRYYEQAGLMERAERGANGYREYGDAALERLNLIQIGQQLGFTLDAIRDVLALEGDALHGGLMQQLDTRLQDIDQMMEALAKQRASLLETKAKVQATWERGECPKSL
ncbi:DNA-binding transcriptional regulator, MerR family [Duganella sp. CF402]|uniref:MerR family transcriptional regulator n=1 Tax=unclassified Duganella TaxID=2636909 RepID=UPI0008B811BD|nr:MULTISPECIES: MerR family transcriptional regulator [unclassified Duganella]RZT04309.1 DNA-binding transcriptional MerR regulator [Duganella sp. BK701]SEM40798.1 DNA-binding transcriptional regulator, MerR family [Duganella sp. CF402]